MDFYMVLAFYNDFLLTCNLGHITQNERDNWYVRILLTHDAVVSFRATYQDLGSPTDALKTAKLKPTNNKTVYLFHQHILGNYSRRFDLSVSHIWTCSNARNCLHL